MKNHSAQLAQNKQLDGSSAKTQQHRDDLFAVAATLRAEVERHLHASVQSQTDALTALLKLELLFGQPPSPSDSAQPAKPPASGWRHPSSCPVGMKVQLMSRNDNEVYGLLVERGRWFVFDRTTKASNANWQPKAWAPIPEWTGEVAE